MSLRARVLVLVAIFAGCALGVWTLRAREAPVRQPRLQPDVPEREPTAATAPEMPAARAPVSEAAADAHPRLPVESVRKRVALTPVVAPPTAATQSNADLWKIGSSGTPDVGIPQRIAALEQLLTRSLTPEERIRTLSHLASTYRADKVPQQQKQVELLQELLQLAGPESEMGQRATVQMGWPLWELGRKREAYDTVLPLTTSPHATERYRGLAHWAALVFALGLDRMPEAEEHYAALKANKEPALHGTRVLAGHRIAAARRKHKR